MASKDFSNKLKSLRLKAGYSQKDVYEHFKIPQSTFSSWEVGKSEPSGEMLIKLCEFYKCDMVKEFSSDNDLSYIEWKIIEKYRSLDSYGQETVSYILDREAERVTSLQKQADHIKQLESRPAALSGISLDDSEDRMRFLSYYQRMASAGNGEFLFPDIPTDLIVVPDTPLSRRADFVIGINGKSMEPTYFDGDKVLVEKTNSVSIGEIGIFIVGTECFIKEAGNDRLISHNKDKEKYPDIIPDERRINTIGRVLGRIGE